MWQFLNKTTLYRMKMNKLFIPLALFSAFSIAQDDSPNAKNDGYFYVGAAYHDTTELDGDSEIIKLKSGFSLNIGKSWVVSNKFSLGLEAEYFDMGDESSTKFYKDHFDNFKFNGSALSLSIKPTYKPMTNGLYFAVLTGVGRYKMESFSNHRSSGWESIQSNERGYSLGGEIGYEFDRFILNLGYSTISTKFNNYNVDLSSFKLGGQYKF